MTVGVLMRKEEEIERCCCNKFYEFFSLLFDSKVCTPFSQFIEGEFLKKFKQEIKEELNNPETNKNKNPKNINKENLSEELSNKTELRIKNNLLINEPDSNIIETSRFGKTQLNQPNNDYNDQRSFSNNISPLRTKGVISTISDNERRSNIDGTLSLSFIKRQDDDSNYVVYDSGYGGNIMNNSHKYGKNTRHRIQKYQSEENSDHNSSRLNGASRNSKGSYRIEYLMSKAFTPIVPTSNHLNEISRITWNRNDLFENITYSNITDSILMVENNNTDNVVKKRKSLICNSNDSVKAEDPAFKPTNEKVKYSLNYHRSLSNSQNSSGHGNRLSNLPKIDHENQNMPDTLKDVKASRRILNARNLSRSKKQPSYVSQKSNAEIDKLNKSFVTADSKIKLEDSDYDYFRKRSKVMISKDQIYNSNLESINLNKRKANVSDSSDKIQALIKCSPANLQQETPRLPTQLQFKSSSLRSSRREDITNNHSQQNDAILNQDQENGSDHENENESPNNLKGFLETTIPQKRRGDHKNNQYILETVCQIEPNISPHTLEHDRRSLEMNKDSVDGNINRRIKNRSQKFDYNQKSPNEAEDSNNKSYILNPSTNLNPHTQIKMYEKSRDSSDVTEKHFKDGKNPPKSYTKISYLKKNISFDDCSVSPIPQHNQALKY